MNGVKIIRKGPNGMTETPVELKKMLQAKVADIPMKADDILFVPSSTSKVIMIAFRGRRRAGCERGIHRRHPLVNRSEQVSDQLRDCVLYAALSGRDRAPLLFSQKLPQHVEIRHGGLAPRKTLQDMAASIATQGFPQLRVPGETQNRLRQFGGIFRLDADSGLGLLQNLARLTLDPENHRTARRT